MARRGNPNSKVRVEVGNMRAMSGTEITVELRVADDASGEMLAVVNFTADEWLGLVIGTSRTMDAFTTTHPERIGRGMKVRRESVPTDVAPRYGRGDDAVEKITAWAKTVAQPGEEVDPRHTNTGWEVIFRSWPVTEADA